MEATTGEASLTGLASIVSMLANASLTKRASGDTFRKIIVDELKMYEKGNVLLDFTGISI